jgi:hypothetical protein
MTSQRKMLQEEMHFRVHRVLQDNQVISLRELAETVEVSIGGSYYVLKALVGKGLLKIGNLAAAKDRCSYAHILTPEGSAVARVFGSVGERCEALREEIDVLERDLDANATRPLA